MAVGVLDVMLRQAGTVAAMSAWRRIGRSSYSISDRQGFSFPHRTFNNAIATRHELLMPCSQIDECMVCIWGITRTNWRIQNGLRWGGSLQSCFGHNKFLH